MRVKHAITALTAILILIMIMLSSGCSYRQGKDKPDVSAKYVATGTEGIVMQWVSNQPPAKVYTTSGIQFLVEVKNRGTYSIPTAYLYLTGYDPRMIPGLVGTKTVTNLEGKSQYQPDGGYTAMDFSVSSISLPTTTPNYQPNFLLTACYPYMTVATPIVCVDPNPTDTISDKSCDIRQKKTMSTGSQGAPVAVTSIESTATPKEMIFRIHVQNMQTTSGLPFDDSSLSKCPGSLDYKDLNRIKHSVTLGSGQIGTCSPTSEIRLVNNRAVIFCKFPHASTGSAYETTLNIDLSYGYKNSISKKVEIENIDYSP